MDNDGYIFFFNKCGRKLISTSANISKCYKRLSLKLEGHAMFLMLVPTPVWDFWIVNINGTNYCKQTNEH
jgi:hypothetical protein